METSPERVEKLISKFQHLLDQPGQSSEVIRQLTATIENLERTLEGLKK